MKNFLIVLFLLASAAIISCEEPITPPNPFDSVKRPDTTTNVTPADPNTITGIHQTILSTRCNNPGCHDGTFEPDFRSVQSSYSTLVYHGVVKTTLDSARYFQYRVIPYDTVNSFIHERLTTSTSDYMPSNGVRLSRKEIKQINTWIMNGAPDINGKVMTEPDLLPTVEGFIAFDNQSNGRLDTIRTTPLDPFQVKYGREIRFLILAKDDKDKTPVDKLSINQLIFSSDKNNFSTSKKYVASYLKAGTYEFYQVVVKTTDFPSGSTQYFRYRVSDGQHGNAFTEMPNDYIPYYFKNVFSVYIKP